MERIDIIGKIGRKYHISDKNEAGEFSYYKALQTIGKNASDFLVAEAAREYKTADIRFTDNKLTVIVETKKKLVSSSASADMKQLQQYVIYERELTNNKIVAILAATQDDNVRVWTDNSGIIDDEHENKSERAIRSFDEYRNIFFGTKNNKTIVMRSTYELNELLRKYGINEKIRGQFVGTCLLSLKEGLKYEGHSTEAIRADISKILMSLLNDSLNKAEKIDILRNKIIDSQDIRVLKQEEFQHILREIEQKILPHINDETKMGQDLLNLFFTTFNKYVGKADKNQAFTPDHIVHFMCKVVGVNKKSYVLDPCCGSGAFLVRAMTEAINDCDTAEEKENVMKKQIYGVEFEDTAFGLATTNMLIHGDGNSNVVQGSCFEVDSYINKGIDVVLMNPPYNAQKKHCCKKYVSTWKNSVKEDPSKGFHFVYEVAENVGKGKLAVLLPMQCAIGTSSGIADYKAKMLEKHTLDAVFSFPADMFHPGASASACCMLFTLSERHCNEKGKPKRETFFGYFKDDGFMKRKNLGRVERRQGIWDKIEKEWLDLYMNRKSVAGKSCTQKVTKDDEWLCEAYMETDYNKLTQADFERTVRDYVAYLVKTGGINGGA